MKMYYLPVEIWHIIFEFIKPKLNFSIFKFRILSPQADIAIRKHYSQKLKIKSMYWWQVSHKYNFYELNFNEYAGFALYKIYHKDFQNLKILKINMPEIKSLQLIKLISNLKITLNKIKIYIPTLNYLGVWKTYLRELKFKKFICNQLNLIIEMKFSIFYGNYPTILKDKLKILCKHLYDYFKRSEVIGYINYDITNPIYKYKKYVGNLEDLYIPLIPYFI